MPDDACVWRPNQSHRQGVQLADGAATALVVCLGGRRASCRLRGRRQALGRGQAKRRRRPVSFGKDETNAGSQEAG